MEGRAIPSQRPERARDDAARTQPWRSRSWKVKMLVMMGQMLSTSVRGVKHESEEKS